MAAYQNLEHFLSAQADVWPHAVAELQAGRKKSHWMWFVFPQLAGLGHSAMSQRYAIQSAAQAKAYLDHPVLGQRLRQAAFLLLSVEGKSANEIFGTPDDLKLRSCMTLFSEVSPAEKVFDEVLKRFFDDCKDERTRQLLRSAGG